MVNRTMIQPRLYGYRKLAAMVFVCIVAAALQAFGAFDGTIAGFLGAAYGAFVTGNALEGFGHPKVALTGSQAIVEVIEETGHPNHSDTGEFEVPENTKPNEVAALMAENDRLRREIRDDK